MPLPCQTRRAMVALDFVAYACSNGRMKTARAAYGEFLMPVCKRYPNLISVRLPLAMFVLVLINSVFQSACGLAGALGGSSTPAPTITSVAVSCNPTSVQSGQTSQCSAAVTGTGNYNSSVTWSASAGSINSSGLFTAPATAATVTVTAASVSNTNMTGISTLNVTTATTITSVSVSCNPTSVETAGTSQCAATVTGTGNYSSAVNWSVNGVQGGGSTVGTISSSGLFTAPSSVPSTNPVTVSATSVADTTQSASAGVTITATSGAAAGTTDSNGTVTLSSGGVTIPLQLNDPATGQPIQGIQASLGYDPTAPGSAVLFVNDPQNRYPQRFVPLVSSTNGRYRPRN